MEHLCVGGRAWKRLIFSLAGVCCYHLRHCYRLIVILLAMVKNSKSFKGQQQGHRMASKIRANSYTERGCALAENNTNKIKLIYFMLYPFRCILWNATVCLPVPLVCSLSWSLLLLVNSWHSALPSLPVPVLRPIHSNHLSHGNTQDESNNFTI